MERERKNLEVEDVLRGKKALAVDREKENKDREIEQCLGEAARKIAPDETARERILAGIRTGKHSRKRLALRVPAAVAAACILICLLWFGSGQMITGDKLVVYAATEEHGWQKLKEGERILLKKEVFQMGFNEEYPYVCTFRLEVPENYLYDREMAIIGADYVSIQKGGKDVIEWWVAKERPEDEGRVMQGVMRLWVVDENRERIGAYELELTKENGNCYAKLNRVWTKRGK